MSQRKRKRWLVTLQQTRLRLEVVYGDTREEALAEAEKLADAASDEVWGDPVWNVVSVNEAEGRRVNMTDEKQDLLYAKYPKIFGQKDLPPTQSMMCDGIATGDGWFGILDALCEDIQTHIDQSGCEQLEAVQVKEKFGELRFYSDGGDSVTDALVSKAERESCNVCERCGSTDGVTTKGPGWIVTWCDKCRKEKE